MKKLEKTLQEEINRYNEINKYAIKLMEQAEPTDALPPAPGGDALPPAPGGDALPAAPDAGSMPTDGAEDTGNSTEEIDITDLVNMTKNIKQQLENPKQNSEIDTKMNDVFSKLSDLEKKLSEMDSVINKIDELGSKIEQMKPPTPVEKLEMRSLDSYPFNQKPDEFFDQKKEEMKISGKNEYILSKDDIQNYNKQSISQSFNPSLGDENSTFTY